ncbi:hypothetical protein [Chryseobacterium indologenes]|nr:hypothetical protein [Chryseobacterium indologenes]
MTTDNAYKIDLIVEDKVIIEVIRCWNYIRFFIPGH